MVEWLFGTKPKPPVDKAWPRHLFINMRGKGLAYVAEVSDEEEASDLVQLIMAQICMETGKVGWADYWTSEKDAFTRDELAAFTAKLTAAR